MGTTAFLEKTTRAVRAEWQEQQAWFAAWIARLKAGVAKSPRQRVRNSSGEKRRKNDESHIRHELDPLWSAGIERWIGRSAAGATAASAGCGNDAGRGG